ncbi:MAG: Na+/H+ antiporter subunit G [Verrucomicrobia bacterium]|jgi:multicomponent Na+:H+ antiporter subunit G|nr:Na+/H+ antiporter subunit G [Verrucomicrobiota bacterium]
MSWLTQAFILLGSLSMLLAAIGLLRFPDFYTRAHAGTKAASLGAGFILIGVVLPISDPDINIRVWLTIFFIFLTVPVAGHLLGRAAYLRGLKQWPGDNVDEWKADDKG